MKQLRFLVAILVLATTPLIANTTPIYIGNPQSTNYNEFPINYYWANAVMQTIYLSSEIGMSGLLTHIEYRFSGQGDVPEDTPIRIYLATTTNDSFSSDSAWIPYNNFTLAFHGSLPVTESGVYNVLIELDSPFQYDVGNLVIMTYRPMSGWFENSNFWQNTATAPNRSLFVRSDMSIINPQNGLSSGTRTNIVANTTLHFLSGDTGTLSGTVQAGGQPIQDALITLHNSTRKAITDSNGEFSIPFLIPGFIDITASAFLYDDVTLNDIEIIPNEITNVTIEMDSKLYDLNALSIVGPTRAIVSDTYTYRVSVLNEGVSSVEANAYTVNIMQRIDGGDDLILSTINGTQILSTETVQFEIDLTPIDHGMTDIYAYVDFPNDQNMDNNSSGILTVDIFPAGTVFSYVGNPSSTTIEVGSPFTYLFNNGVSQTIYLEEEIGGYGVITHLIYRFTGNGSLPNNLPVRLYLATTDKPSFFSTTDWFEYEDFTLVFEGTLPVNIVGTQHIKITLDTPFPYFNDNLVVMGHRMMSQGGEYLNNWQHTYVSGYPRTLLQMHMNLVYDLTDLPDGITRQTIANVEIILQTEGLGSLKGTVYHQGVPLSEARVMLNELNRFVITDSSGEYEFNNLVSGTYSLSASRHGFDDSYISNIEVNMNAATTVDIHMVQQNVINVTGTVLASDTLSGIEGATVSLIGLESYYDFQTNSQGFFTIPEVYTGYFYDLVVSKQGYSRHTQEIYISGLNDFSVGTITLQEQANPPRNILAVEQNNNVSLTWEAPLLGNEIFFSHAKSEEHSDSVGAPNGLAAQFTTAMRFNQEQLQEFGVSGALLTAVSFYPNLADADFTLQIHVGGSVNPINPGTLVHSQLVNVTYNRWNFIELDNQIEIPTTGELWIGYHVDVRSGYPAAFTDRGSGYVGFGDLLQWNNVWNVLAANGLSANWMIQGFAEGAAKRTAFPIENSPPTRILESYNIYRAKSDEVDDQDKWTTLELNVTGTEYTDTTWSSLETGAYRYIIQAVFTNENISRPGLSNLIGKNMTSTVTINIQTEDGNTPDGALVNLVDNGGNLLQTYQQTVTNNQVVFHNVWYGEYTLSIAKMSYSSYINEYFVVNTPNTNYDVILQNTDIWIQESFENSQFPPLGWTLIDADGDTVNWIQWNIVVAGGPGFGHISHTGQNSAVSQSYRNPPTPGALTPDNYLITPQIVLPDVESATLKFYVWTLLHQHPIETLSVLISTDTIDPEDFYLPVYMKTMGASDADIQEVEIDLSIFAGQAIYIAFRHHDSFDNFAIGLDDIELIVTPKAQPLFPPINFTGVQIEDTNSALLTWEAPQGANPIEYTIFRDNVELATTTDFEFIDTGLLHGTYTYSILAVYSYGVSAKVEAIVNIIIIDPDYPPPTNVNAVDHKSYALITWDSPETIVYFSRQNSRFANINNDSSRNRQTLNSAPTYNVYRATQENVNNLDEWETIRNDLTETEYTDDTWDTVQPNSYFYLVIAVYSNDMYSVHATSNLIVKPLHNPIQNPRYQLVNDNKDVRLAWDAPQGSTSLPTEYLIQRDGHDFTTTSLTYTDVAPGYGDFVYYITAIYTTGSSIPVELEVYVPTSIDDEPTIPEITFLRNNFPNPFNPVTNIAFDIAKDTNVLINIFNIRGQLVTTLVNEQFTPGRYTIQWEANNASTGVYFYQMITDDYKETRRMILVK